MTAAVQQCCMKYTTGFISCSITGYVRMVHVIANTGQEKFKFTLLGVKSLTRTRNHFKNLECVLHSNEMNNLLPNVDASITFVKERKKHLMHFHCDLLNV